MDIEDITNDITGDEPPDFDEGESILVSCSFYCHEIEYETRYLDGVIPVLVPVDVWDEDEDEDDEILDDEHVIQAVIEKDEYELISSLEGDKQSIDYFCEHSEGLSEKGKKMLEKMRESIRS